MRIAGRSFTDKDEVRLVKLTRKPKPKVAAKTVVSYFANGTCLCCHGEGLDVYRHLQHVNGKRIRITLEELES